MRALFERITSPRPSSQLLSLQEQLEELARSVRAEVQRIVLGRSYFEHAEDPSRATAGAIATRRDILDYGVGSPLGGVGLREYAHRMERALIEYEPRLDNPRVSAVPNGVGDPRVEVRGTLLLGELQRPFYFVTGEEGTSDE